MKKLLILALLLAALGGSAFGQTPNGAYSSPASSGGGISFVSSLPATCTPGTTQAVQLSVPPYGLFTCGPQVNQWTSTADISKAISCATCKADLQAVFDATITNGSANVTTSGGDAAFTSADSVKACFATTGGVGGGLSHTQSKLSMAHGTFTFVSAHAGTCSVANANASGTNTNIFIWASDDGLGGTTSPLGVAWTNATNTGGTCFTFTFPAHPFLTSTNFGTTTTPTCKMPVSGGTDVDMTVLGFGQDTSLMVVDPSFDPTTCGAIACFFGPPAILLSDFGVWGGERGDCPATFNGKNLMAIVNDAGVNHLFLVGWCSGSTNTSIGLNAGFGGGCTLTSNDGFGNTSFNVAATTRALYCAFGDTTLGVQVQSGATLIATSDLYYDVPNAAVAVNINPGAAFSSVNDQWANFGAESFFGMEVNGATAFITNASDIINSSTGATGIYITGAGKANVVNSRIFGGSASNDVVFDSTATFNDLGGNTFGQNRVTPNAVGVTYIADGMSFTGACTGVVSAGGGTFGLYGTGPNATTTTCTSATIGTGIVMTQARTMTNLWVTVTAAGNNAGTSGVVTILKNGGATTITCTVGTATFCGDRLHQVAFAAGDLISLQFSSPAGDTLAGMKALVKWN